MYAVSDLYNTIIAQENHWFQSRVNINGVSYSQDKIFSISIEHRMFTESQPTVGGCLSAELTAALFAPSSAIPRMARVRPYVRVTNGTQTSEWVPQGIYYIDTRETTNNDDDLPILTLHCYDAMLKSEADFPNVSSHSWPSNAGRVVADIAAAMGVTVDSRTYDVINAHSYGNIIGLPLGYSMREVLSQIASMYAGNWVMSYDGKLLLIPINALPQETNYLIDSQYDAITFGGDRILV